MPGSGRAARTTRKDRPERNRIRRLLATEYYEFSETVLIESPFAETSRSGRGIRQVCLALTPSRLIVAADTLIAEHEFLCPSTSDPGIQNFELISIYPLEYVTLSVFRRRRRKTLKARFINGRVSYYELAGTQRKKIVWRLWCERVQSLLEKKIDGSSLSEPTAASSSSSCTLYLFPRAVRRGGRGRKRCRIWAQHVGGGDNGATWPTKDLYLGPSHNELSNRYAPVPVRFAGASLEEVRNELRDYSPSSVGNNRPCQSWPVCQTVKQHRRPRIDLCDVLFVKEHGFGYCRVCMTCHSCHSCRFELESNDPEGQVAWCDNERYYETFKEPRKGFSRKVPRFGSGVMEKCSSGLILGPFKGEADYPDKRKTGGQRLDPEEMADSAISVWESKRRSRSHPRRYGLSSAAHFLHAVGPWSVQPGERQLLEGRRSFSLVAVRRKPVEPELRLPVSRRQLSASVSCDSLRTGSLSSGPRGRLVLFWTPDYWYRPRPAAAAYKDLRHHLDSLKEFQQKDHPHRKLFHRKRRQSGTREFSSQTEERSTSFLGRIFSSGSSAKRKEQDREVDDETTHLRRLLRMDFRITVWDLDSLTLARQLTMIDRDLFLRIPLEEVQLLLSQKSSRNTPNIGAWIAFSHRISCLTVSEVLAVKKLEMRSRILARFANVANKCFDMGNFQSCRSILAGLQAPPIYRLRATWSYLRTHHATRYEIVERLCKIFKSPLNNSYRKSWARVERNPPLIPYVGDIIVKLLGLKCPERESFSERLRPGIEVTRYHCSTSKATTTRSSQTTDMSSERRESFGRRLLGLALGRGAKTNRERSKLEQDLVAIAVQQDLARKYFYRWINIVLRSKIRAREREKSKMMNARIRRVLEVASWLMDCQRHAQGYDFPGHSFAQEFLLKSRYREDRENFFVSLKLEPARVT